MRNLIYIAGAFLALAGISLLAGCEGKPTKGDTNDPRSYGPPPVVQAAAVPLPIGQSDPLSDPIWAKATWYLLQAPMNTTRTTPPARAAMMYDADALYVAFVSDTVPPPASPIDKDIVSVFLDTSKAANGTETAQFSVDAAGHYNCTWIRCGSPAVAKDDGSPETHHPLDRFPDYSVTGFTAATHKATYNGNPVWTTVVTIPFKNLPIPLRVTPAGGEHWKVNLLRTITTVNTGAGAQQLQANLSPVYLGAQAVSPYRMAVLDMAK